MAQKKTAAAKTARKTVKQSAPKAARLVVVSEATKAAKGAMAAGTAAASKVNKDLRQATEAAVATQTAAANNVNKALRQTTEAASKGLGDLASVGQENFEACVKSGTIAAKGAETLGNEVMTFTQASIEADLAAAKDIMTAKSFREALDLQTSFAQARLQRMTSETAKLGELSMRLASQAMEPLRSRFDANAWTIFRPLGR